MWKDCPSHEPATIFLDCKFMALQRPSEKPPGLLPVPWHPVLLLALPACCMARAWSSFYSKGRQSAEFPNLRFFHFDFPPFLFCPNNTFILCKENQAVLALRVKDFMGNTKGQAGQWLKLFSCQEGGEERCLRRAFPGRQQG